MDGGSHRPWRRDGQFFPLAQAPFAQEQMHSALLQVDGKPAPAFAEVQKLAEGIKNWLDEAGIKTITMPKGIRLRRMGDQYLLCNYLDEIVKFRDIQLKPASTKLVSASKLNPDIL